MKQDCRDCFASTMSSTSYYGTGEASDMFADTCRMPVICVRSFLSGLSLSLNYPNGIGAQFATSTNYSYGALYSIVKKKFSFRNLSYLCPYWNYAT